MNEKLRQWARECAQTPGRKWRVHAYDGDNDVEVENQGVFDELVVDHWLHVEQMDERVWFVRVGEQGINVTVQSDGEVIVELRVAVEGE